jgi:hypothetical protein
VVDGGVVCGSNTRTALTPAPSTGGVVCRRRERKLRRGVNREGARHPQGGFHAHPDFARFVVIAAHVDRSGLVAIGVSANRPAENAGGFICRHPVARAKRRRRFCVDTGQLNRHHVVTSNAGARWGRHGSNAMADVAGVGRVVDRVVPIRSDAANVVPTPKCPNLSRLTEGLSFDVGQRARPRLSVAELCLGRRRGPGHACGDGGRRGR